MVPKARRWRADALSRNRMRERQSSRSPPSHLKGQGKKAKDVLKLIKKGAPHQNPMLMLLPRTDLPRQKVSKDSCFCARKKGKGCAQVDKQGDTTAKPDIDALATH
eukprot:c23130_g2_i1 orf=81-398(-)